MGVRSHGAGRNMTNILNTITRGCRVITGLLPERK